MKSASEYQDIFGKDRYFLELMDHGIEIERRVRDGLLEIGKKLGIPPLVTNDSHYTYASEAGAHDALLCIQTGKNLSDPDRFRFDGSGYFFVVADFIMWAKNQGIAVGPGPGTVDRRQVRELEILSGELGRRLRGR